MERCRLPLRHRLAALGLACAALAAGLPARGEEADDTGLAATLAAQLERFADETTRTLGDKMPGRLSVEVGRIDPRLRLAPCARIEPYLPRGTRLWGKAHIGVRCAEGPKRWNVYLPITVSVMAPALVAATPLASGATIGPADLMEAEVDLAAAQGSLYTDPAQLVGRVLQRPVGAGQGIRDTDVKLRQWFAAGDTVGISSVGGGFAVRSTGQALTPGFEGQTARIRTDSGRIISGVAVGEREVELRL